MAGLVEGQEYSILSPGLRGIHSQTSKVNLLKVVLLEAVNTTKTYETTKSKKNIH